MKNEHFSIDQNGFQIIADILSYNMRPLFFFHVSLSECNVCNIFFTKFILNVYAKPTYPYVVLLPIRGKFVDWWQFNTFLLILS